MNIPMSSIGLQFSNNNKRQHLYKQHYYLWLLVRQPTQPNDTSNAKP